jgi:hypothetical protein
MVFSFDDHRLGITFTATEFGGSRMIAILNRESKNEAVLEVNLDLLFDDRSVNSSVYWAEGVENLDACSYSKSFENTSVSTKRLADDMSVLLIDIVRQ